MDFSTALAKTTSAITVADGFPVDRIVVAAYEQGGATAALEYVADVMATVGNDETIPAKARRADLAWHLAAANLLIGAYGADFDNLSDARRDAVYGAMAGTNSTYTRILRSAQNFIDSL